MKPIFRSSFAIMATAATASAGSLYYVPNDLEETLPIEWTVGLEAIYDDNTTPTAAASDDETFALNAYVQFAAASRSPQTTWNVLAKLGVLYYLDEPEALGSEDTYEQANLIANLNHRFSQRLRLASRNSISYELEPEYSNGVASNRQLGEYLYWSTDNSIDFDWTSRFGSRTGFSLTGLEYDDIDSADRFTWTLYNQFRYDLNPTTVVTAEYRYSDTSGSDAARDSQDQYLLAGIERRISYTTTLVAKAGAQFRDVDGPNGDSSTSPYMELALNSQINSQFGVQVFARYGIEAYDTVQFDPSIGLVPAEFDNRSTLRVGVKGNYSVSPDLNLFGGVNLISTSFEDGRLTTTGAAVSDFDETLINAYIGASLRLTEYLTASLTYNFTDSNSDFSSRDYDRNRISLGLAAQF